MDGRHALGKAALLLLCWILSLAAFFLPLANLDRFSLFLQVFVPAALIFGYLSLWAIPRVFLKWQLWIAAAVFAAVVTVGAAFHNAETAEFVTNHKWRALVYFLGRVPAFYAGMVLALEIMKKGGVPRRRYPAAAYASALFLCWLPYLCAVWPGSVSAEAAAQLSALSGGGAVTGGPLLQAGFIGLAFAAGRGIFGSADAAVTLYVLAQALLAAWLLGRVVSNIAADGAPKWLILSSLLFFALCPVFPLYAFAVSSGTSFALAALWLTLTVWKLVRSERAATRDVIALCASAVLCALLRYQGIFLAAAPLAALIVWSRMRQNEVWQGAMYALACAACALFLLQAAVVPMLSGAGGAAEAAAPEEPFRYGYLMPGFVSDTEPTFILGAADGAAAQAQIAVNPQAVAMKAVFNRLLTYAPFRILASPGLYGWIALFALAVLLERKRWTALIALLVPWAALILCMAAPVNGSLAFALPVCLAAPVFLSAVAQAVRNAPPDGV